MRRRRRRRYLRSTSEGGGRANYARKVERSPVVVVVTGVRRAREGEGKLRAQGRAIPGRRRRHVLSVMSAMAEQYHKLPWTGDMETEGRNTTYYVEHTAGTNSHKNTLCEAGKQESGSR